MATIRILLGIICLVSTLSNRLPSVGFLIAVEKELIVFRCSFFVGHRGEKEAKAEDKVEAWTMDGRRQTMDVVRCSLFVLHSVSPTENCQLETGLSESLGFREVKSKVKDEVTHSTLSTFNFQLLTREKEAEDKVEAWTMDGRRQTMDVVRCSLFVLHSVSPTENCQLETGLLKSLGVMGEKEAKDKTEHARLRTSDSRLWTSDSRLPTPDFQLLTLDSEAKVEAWTMDERRKTMDERGERLDRHGLIQIACSQIGVREATGQNDGRAVETYLRYTGNRKGEPWCASFVSWVFAKAGFKLPKTAWSPALFPIARQIKQPVVANVFGIYFSNLKRIAHCGLVEAVKGSWIGTIEGNTNTTGSREGDGVYRKLRHVKTIAVYANWLKQGRKGALQ